MESIKTNESLAQKITKAQSALENVTVSAEEAEDGQGPSGLQGKSELGLANPGRWGCGCNSHSGHPQPMDTGASTFKPSTVGSNVSDPKPAGENDIMKEHLYVTRRLIDVIERHCNRLFRLEEKYWAAHQYSTLQQMKTHKTQMLHPGPNWKMKFNMDIGATQR